MARSKQVRVDMAKQTGSQFFDRKELLRSRVRKANHRAVFLRQYQDLLECLGLEEDDVMIEVVVLK